MNRRTGRHCRPVLKLPTGQFNNFRDDPGAHGMNRGQTKMNRTGQELMRRAVGMAWQRRAGTQPAEQATAGGHSRRTLRPAQASKQQPAVGRPCSKNNSCRRCWPASRRPVQVAGGSTVVLAARKAGADLPNLSLPHLSPLPVTVPTHSLNL